MAIDHGTRRIGVAFSDPMETLATPHVVWPNDAERIVERLAALAREESVEAVVIGLPRHDDGNESATAPAVRKFAAAIETVLPSGVPVQLWDESLTTVEAERILSERGVPPAERKQKVDAFAAALILEDLIGSRRRRGIPIDSSAV